MNQQRAIADLFKCRAERRQQIGRQCANETDSVVDDHFLLARHTSPARSRIERREHALLRVHGALRQGVQQRGFAGVGVTNNRDDRQCVPRSSFAALLAALALRFNLTLETVDAIANTTAIAWSRRRFPS